MTTNRSAPKTNEPTAEGLPLSAEQSLQPLSAEQSLQPLPAEQSLQQQSTEQSIQQPSTERSGQQLPAEKSLQQNPVEKKSAPVKTESEAEAESGTQPFIALNSSVFTGSKCGGIIVDYLAAIDLDKIIAGNSKLDITQNPQDLALRQTLVKTGTEQLAKRWPILAANLITVVNKARAIKNHGIVVEEKIAAVDKDRYDILCEQYAGVLYELLENYIQNKIVIDFNYIQDAIAHYCIANPIKAGVLLTQSIYYVPRKWDAARCFIDNNASLHQSHLDRSNNTYTVHPIRLCATFDDKENFLQVFIDKVTKSEYKLAQNQYSFFYGKFKFTITPLMDTLRADGGLIKFDDSPSLPRMKNAGLLLNTFPEEMQLSLDMIRHGMKNAARLDSTPIYHRSGGLLQTKFLLFYAYEKEFKGKKTIFPDKKDKQDILTFLTQHINEAKSVDELYAIYKHNINAYYLGHRRHFQFDFMTNYPKTKILFIEHLRRRAIAFMEAASNVDSFDVYSKKCLALKDHDIFDMRHELRGVSNLYRLELENRVATNNKATLR